MYIKNSSVTHTRTHIHHTRCCVCVRACVFLSTDVYVCLDVKSSVILSCRLNNDLLILDEALGQLVGFMPFVFV